MVTAGTEPGVVPLTEVVVLFNKVQEKPILILLALFYEGHLQCVCISYVNFMLGKKRGCCGPLLDGQYSAERKGAEEQKQAWSYNTVVEMEEMLCSISDLLKDAISLG